MEKNNKFSSFFTSAGTIIQFNFPFHVVVKFDFSILYANENSLKTKLNFVNSMFDFNSFNSEQ